MAVEIFRKRSTEPASLIELPELVTVGVHKDSISTKLTFSGGTQRNAVIVADPPTLILTAASGVTNTRVFRVTFQVESSGWQYPADGALRILVGSKDAGVQIPPDTPTEVTVLLYTDLKIKQQELGSFELGLVQIPGNEAFLEDGDVPQIVWHDPSILWEPPMT